MKAFNLALETVDVARSFTKLSDLGFRIELQNPAQDPKDQFVPDIHASGHASESSKKLPTRVYEYLAVYDRQRRCVVKSEERRSGSSRVPYRFSFPKHTNELRNWQSHVRNDLFIFESNYTSLLWRNEGPILALETAKSLGKSDFNIGIGIESNSTFWSIKGTKHLTVCKFDIVSCGSGHNALSLFGVAINPRNYSGELFNI
mmetsp:Transcript_32710/g.84470  ORF Transcript_32710/g.84470 Transcript_32710/m.84470 type:complete len:202 (-) Transcript_32710:450-1055(-)